MAVKWLGLRHLDLTANPALTDAALDHLAGLTGFTQLALDSEKITPDALKRLQAKLPKCKVRSTPVP